jgi:hypothetical protein
MRLHKILLLLVGSFLLVGGTAYFFGEKSVEAPSALSTNLELADPSAQLATVVAIEDSKPLFGTGTFKDIQSLKQDLVCEITSLSNDNGAVVGKVFLSEEKIRGEFDIQQAGKLFASNMLLDGETIYFWTETPAGTLAFKNNIKNISSEISTEAKSATPLSIEEAVTYDCQSWTKQEDKFTIPTDVQFIELPTNLTS